MIDANPPQAHRTAASLLKRACSQGRIRRRQASKAPPRGERTKGGLEFRLHVDLRRAGPSAGCLLLSGGENERFQGCQH